MTRRGSFQRPWTTDELDRLRDMAGRIPAHAIACGLDRSYWSVVKAAERIDISLRCRIPRLVWCNECATWRSRIDANGRCPVCSMREMLAGREAACSRELAAMTLEQRSVYAKQESGRGTRSSSIKARPRKRESCPISRYEREKAEADYLLAIEDWERRRLTLQYNAAKTRLRRMREQVGTNPRKNN